MTMISNCLILALCVTVALSVPSASSAASSSAASKFISPVISDKKKIMIQPVKPSEFASRDGAHHGGGGGGSHGGGHGGGGHGGGGHVAPHGGGHPQPQSSYGAPPVHHAPAPSYSQPAQDTGYYYYYYPVVEEEDKTKGMFDGMKEMFDKMFKSMMYPIMYPFMMMYDMFSGGKDKQKGQQGGGGGYGYGGGQSSYGGGGGSSYGSYRSFSENVMDYVPWDSLETGRKLAVSALQKDDCMKRFICHSSAVAEGRATILEILEVVIPKHYQKSFKVFKDSALKKTSCKRSYRCKYVDGALDAYDELSDDNTTKTTANLKSQKSE